MHTVLATPRWRCLSLDLSLALDGYPGGWAQRAHHAGDETPATALQRARRWLPSAPASQSDRPDLGPLTVVRPRSHIPDGHRASLEGNMLKRTRSACKLDKALTLLLIDHIGVEQ